MRSKVFIIALAVAFLAAVPILSSAQAEPSATGPAGRSLTVGAGLSYNFLGLSKDSHMAGFAGWVDWRCFADSRWLSRAAIEFEGRDVNMGQPSDMPYLRIDTAQGGLNFTILSGSHTRFYGKGLGGVGRAVVPPGIFEGTTERMMGILSLGEGLDIRLNRLFSLKTEVETQVWPDFYPHGSALTTSSITVGVLHTFGGNRRELPTY